MWKTAGWMPSSRWQTFELELKCMSQLYKFDVWISGTMPKGDTKKAKPKLRRRVR